MIGIKSTHPLEKMRFLFIQNTNLSQGSTLGRDSDGPFCGRYLIQGMKQRKRKRGLPNSRIGSGNFQLHMKLTKTKNVCDDNEAQGWGSLGTGKRVEGSWANWKCFGIEWDLEVLLDR